MRYGLHTRALHLRLGVQYERTQECAVTTSSWLNHITTHFFAIVGHHHIMVLYDQNHNPFRKFELSNQMLKGSEYLAPKHNLDIKSRHSIT